MQKFNILFVCMGNICRSPIAEGVAKRVVKQRGLSVGVDSAGTTRYHMDMPPCANSVKVAKMHGVDISNQRAKQVDKAMLERADLVIALDEKNYVDLKKMGAVNLYKLGEFGFDGADVPDPYFFNGFEGFERVYTMIEEAIYKLFDEKIEG